MKAYSAKKLTYAALVISSLSSTNCKKNSPGHVLNQSDTPEKIDAQSLAVNITSVREQATGKHYGLEIEIERSLGPSHYEIYVCSVTAPDRCQPSKDQPDTFTLSQHSLADVPDGEVRAYVRACVDSDIASDPDRPCGRYSMSDIVTIRPSQDPKTATLLKEQNTIKKNNKKACQEYIDSLKEIDLVAASNAKEKPLAKLATSQIAMGAPMICEMAQSPILQPIEDNIRLEHIKNTSGDPHNAVTENEDPQQRESDIEEIKEAGQLNIANILDTSLGKRIEIENHSPALAFLALGALATATGIGVTGIGIYKARRARLGLTQDDKTAENFAALEEIILNLKTKLETDQKTYDDRLKKLQESIHKTNNAKKNLPSNPQTHRTISAQSVKIKEIEKEIRKTQDLVDANQRKITNTSKLENFITSLKPSIDKHGKPEDLKEQLEELQKSLNEQKNRHQNSLDEIRAEKRAAEEALKDIQNTIKNTHETIHQNDRAFLDEQQSIKRHYLYALEEIDRSRIEYTKTTNENERLSRIIEDQIKDIQNYESIKYVIDHNDRIIASLEREKLSQETEKNREIASLREVIGTKEEVIKKQTQELSDYLDLKQKLESTTADLALSIAKQRLSEETINQLQEQEKKSKESSIQLGRQLKEANNNLAKATAKKDKLTKEVESLKKTLNNRIANLSARTKRIHIEKTNVHEAMKTLLERLTQVKQNIDSERDLNTERRKKLEDEVSELEKAKADLESQLAAKTRQPNNSRVDIQRQTHHHPEKFTPQAARTRPTPGIRWLISGLALTVTGIAITAFGAGKLSESHPKRSLELADAPPKELRKVIFDFYFAMEKGRRRLLLNRAAISRHLQATAE